MAVHLLLLTVLPPAVFGYSVQDPDRWLRLEKFLAFIYPFYAFFFVFFSFFTEILAAHKNQHLGGLTFLCVGSLVSLI